MNILAVDDHPTNLTVLRLVLQANGHRVLLADNGVVALELLAREPVDLIISDILMPRMDGYRLCHEVRRDERWAHVPFIVYTSTYTSPSDEKLSYELGADKYLRKPASPDVLLAAVTEVTTRPRTQRSPPPALTELDVLKEYSEGLVKRLEEKNYELSLTLAELKRNEQALLEVNASLELKVAERTTALRQVAERAENADRLKSQFLANMSHELRTPLNSILGFCGTLLMQLTGPLNSQQEEQLKIVQASAQHLLSLINDLLDLARIEAGRMQVRREPVACQPLLEGIVAMLRPLAARKGLDLDARGPRELIYVPTDGRALKQILLNFSNNAIKFTDAGAVTLTLEERIADRGPIVEFSVTDTGRGIEPQFQEKLFQAFAQTDTANREGTGLGLHLSRRLAQLIGGEVGFSSQLGSGSRFWLTLPRE